MPGQEGSAGRDDAARVAAARPGKPSIRAAAVQIAPDLDSQAGTLERVAKA